MKLYPFEMERWQSTWENQVEYNLSESGVHPLRLDEILDGNTAGLLNQRLGYSQSNGTEELRGMISRLYPQATVHDVLVTTGSSEANFVVVFSFLERGAEVAIVSPNYMQVWGLAKTLQAKVRPVWLKERQGRWTLDIRALRKSVSRRTKLIAVCNPNNPTGAVLGEDEIDQVCEVAKKVGAWVLSDEVYRGAELDDIETPTFWGRYENSIVTSGLSKAYGLPGLRIGWVATRDRANELWAYRDYTTIAPSAISDYLARQVLRPESQVRILGRTRKILQSNLPRLTRWVERHRDCISFIQPKAGAIAYLKYSLNINSTELAKRLLTEKDTLIVPGDQFHMDHYLRIGYGGIPDQLEAGLARVGDLLQNLQATPN
jgi:aspartate/methionine/tyrosine aminotransferase